MSLRFLSVVAISTVVMGKGWNKQTWDQPEWMEERQEGATKEQRAAQRMREMKALWSQTDSGKKGIEWTDIQIKPCNKNWRTDSSEPSETEDESSELDLDLDDSEDEVSEPEEDESASVEEKSFGT